ncbi:Ig-like domain-containing protein [Thioalkalivibrio sp. AKL12]|uniref:Ig-like domain-containing protein n=1 Tax=Thioalkalivibrio sp. AKL12 TaxID=1158159 RepID=UPI0003AA4A31|nr:Ig-like domain-containing protein [Thioalkalivibrio sp. AKL12]
MSDAAADVEIYVDGTLLDSTQVEDKFDISEADGEATYTAKADAFDGSEAVVVSASLDSGLEQNTSTVAATLEAIDTSAPAGPTLQVVHSDATAQNLADGAVTVSAEAGSTVVVTFDDGTDTVDLTLTGTGAPQLVAVPGHAELADGAITVSAVATDAAGNESGTTTESNLFTLDTEAPEGLSIAEIGDGGVVNAAANSDLVISGQAEAGATVRLTTTSGVVIAEFEADSNGDWTYTVADAADVFDQGGETITAVQLDDAGNVSGAVSRTFEVDTMTPTPPTLEVVHSDATAQNAFDGAVKVSAEVGKTVEVSFLTSVSETVTLTGQGEDSPVPVVLTPEQVEALGDGEITVNATAMDAAGNATASIGTVNFTLDTEVPEGLSIAEIGDGDVVNAAANSDLVISGQAEAGATVRLTTTSGEVITELTSNAETGDWSVTFDADDASDLFGQGGETITAVQLDEAGNVSGAVSRTFEVDTIAPDAPVITLTAPQIESEPQSVNGQDALLQVKAEAGAIIEIVFDPANGEGRESAVTKSLVATGLEQSVSLSASELAALGDGTVNVTATATDSAGNESSQASEVDAFVLDTEAPAAPTINVIAGDDLIDVTEADSDVTISGTAPGAAEVTLVFTSGYELLGGNTLQVDSNGDWTVDIPAAALPGDFGQGSETVTAIATDAAGNTSHVSARSFVIDTVSPTAPEITTEEIRSNTASQTIEGTADAGSTVTLLLGTTVLATTVADAEGDWAASVNLDGRGSLFAVAVGAAGNVSGDPVDFTVNATWNDQNEFDQDNADNAFSLNDVFDGNSLVQSFADRIAGYDPSTVPLEITDPLTVEQAVALSQKGFDTFDLTYSVEDSYAVVKVALGDPDQRAALAAAEQVVAKGTPDPDTDMNFIGFGSDINLRIEAGDSDDVIRAGTGGDEIVGGLGADVIKLPGEETARAQDSVIYETRFDGQTFPISTVTFSTEDEEYREGSVLTVTINGKVYQTAELEAGQDPADAVQRLADAILDSRNLADPDDVVVGKFYDLSGESFTEVSALRLSGQPEDGSFTVPSGFAFLPQHRIVELGLEDGDTPSMAQLLSFGKLGGSTYSIGDREIFSVEILDNLNGSESTAFADASDNGAFIVADRDELFLSFPNLSAEDVEAALHTLIDDQDVRDARVIDDPANETLQLQITGNFERGLEVLDGSGDGESRIQLIENDGQKTIWEVEFPDSEGWPTRTNEGNNTPFDRTVAIEIDVVDDDAYTVESDVVFFDGFVLKNETDLDSAIANDKVDSSLALSGDFDANEVVVDVNQINAGNTLSIHGLTLGSGATADVVRFVDLGEAADISEFADAIESVEIAENLTNYNEVFQDKDFISFRLNLVGGGSVELIDLIAQDAIPSGAVADLIGGAAGLGAYGAQVVDSAQIEELLGALGANIDFGPDRTNEQLTLVEEPQGDGRVVLGPIFRPAGDGETFVPGDVQDLELDVADVAASIEALKAAINDKQDLSDAVEATIDGDGKLVLTASEGGEESFSVQTVEIEQNGVQQRTDVTFSTDPDDYFDGGQLRVEIAGQTVEVAMVAGDPAQSLSDLADAVQGEASLKSTIESATVVGDGTLRITAATEEPDPLDATGELDFQGEFQTATITLEDATQYDFFTDGTDVSSDGRGAQVYFDGGEVFLTVSDSQGEGTAVVSADMVAGEPGDTAQALVDAIDLGINGVEAQELPAVVTIEGDFNDGDPLGELGQTLSFFYTTSGDGGVSDSNAGLFSGDTQAASGVGVYVDGSSSPPPISLGNYYNPATVGDFVLFIDVLDGISAEIDGNGDIVISSTRVGENASLSVTISGTLAEAEGIAIEESDAQGSSTEAVPKDDDLAALLQSVELDEGDIVLTAAEAGKETFRIDDAVLDYEGVKQLAEVTFSTTDGDYFGDQGKLSVTIQPDGEDALAPIEVDMVNNNAQQTLDDLVAAIQAEISDGSLAGLVGEVSEDGGTITLTSAEAVREAFTVSSATISEPGETEKTTVSFSGTDGDYFEKAIDEAESDGKVSVTVLGQTFTVDMVDDDAHATIQALFDALDEGEDGQNNPLTNDVAVSRDGTTLTFEGQSFGTDLNISAGASVDAVKQVTTIEFEDEFSDGDFFSDSGRPLSITVAGETFEVDGDTRLEILEDLESQLETAISDDSNNGGDGISAVLEAGGIELDDSNSAPTPTLTLTAKFGGANPFTVSNLTRESIDDDNSEEQQMELRFTGSFMDSLNGAGEALVINMGRAEAVSVTFENTSDRADVAQAIKDALEADEFIDSVTVDGDNRDFLVTAAVAGDGILGKDVSGAEDEVTVTFDGGSLSTEFSVEETEPAGVLVTDGTETVASSSTTDGTDFVASESLGDDVSVDREAENVSQEDATIANPGAGNETLFGDPAISATPVVDETDDAPDGDHRVFASGTEDIVLAPVFVSDGAGGFERGERSDLDNGGFALKNLSDLESGVANNTISGELGANVTMPEDGDGLLLTQFELDETNSEILNFGANFPLLSRGRFDDILTGAESFEAGDNVYNYVTQVFTPTESGTYTFGQTDAPVDTLLLIYSEEFDPDNPGDNLLFYNDDYETQWNGTEWDGTLPEAIEDALVGAMVNGALRKDRLPAIQEELEAGEDYHVVISTFQPTSDAELDFPLSFFAFGPGEVGLFEEFGSDEVVVTTEDLESDPLRIFGFTLGDEPGRGDVLRFSDLEDVDALKGAVASIQVAENATDFHEIFQDKDFLSIRLNLDGGKSIELYDLIASDLAGSGLANEAGVAGAFGNVLDQGLDTLIDELAPNLAFGDPQPDGVRQTFTNPEDGYDAIEASPELDSEGESEGDETLFGSESGEYTEEGLRTEFLQGGVFDEADTAAGLRLYTVDRDGNDLTGLVGSETAAEGAEAEADAVDAGDVERTVDGLDPFEWGDGEGESEVNVLTLGNDGPDIIHNFHVDDDRIALEGPLKASTEVGDVEAVSNIPGTPFDLSQDEFGIISSAPSGIDLGSAEEIANLLSNGGSFFLQADDNGQLNTSIFAITGSDDDSLTAIWAHQQSSAGDDSVEAAELYKLALVNTIGDGTFSADNFGADEKDPHMPG